MPDQPGFGGSYRPTEAELDDRSITGITVDALYQALDARFIRIWRRTVCCSAIGSRRSGSNGRGPRRNWPNRAGLDRKIINRIENGRHSPSLDRILVLAYALGVEPDVERLGKQHHCRQVSFASLSMLVIFRGIVILARWCRGDVRFTNVAVSDRTEM